MILAANPLFCLRPFEEVLPKVSQNFDGWELLAEKEHGWDHREKISDLLSTAELEIQIHAPFNDINIASMNERLRQTGISEIERSFEMANMLSAEIVTLHPGVYSPVGRYWEGSRDAVNKSLEEIDDLADEYGVTAAVENLPKMDVTMGSRPEEIRDLTSDRDISFCLDIGHAYTSGCLKEFLNFEPVNIHIHDNKGGKDLHLPLGEGEIDFKMVLEDLKDYEGNYVVEGRDLEGMVRSRRFLDDLLDKI